MLQAPPDTDILKCLCMSVYTYTHAQTYVCMSVKELILDFGITDESSTSKIVLQAMFLFS